MSASVWAGRGGTAGAQEQREITPRLGLRFPVAASRWTHFFLDAGGGPLIAKQPKESVGSGAEGGVGAGIEAMLMKDPHLALELRGGMSYYSYKSETLGSGAATGFDLGFTYYF